MNPEPARQAVLQIHRDPAELSPNRTKIHWRERDRRRDIWKLLTLDAWNGAGCPVFRRKVRITFRVFRGRVLDEDNLHASLAFKFVVDALKGRALADDSPAYVERGSVKQYPGPAYRHSPRVVIEITETDPQEGGLPAEAES